MFRVLIYKSKLVFERKRLGSDEKYFEFLSKKGIYSSKDLFPECEKYVDRI